jgi:hypothetical protein
MDQHWFSQEGKRWIRIRIENNAYLQHWFLTISPLIETHIFAALVKSKKLILKNLKHFILDECDKMLAELDMRRDVQVRDRIKI